MNRPLRVLIDGRMLLGRYSGVARMVTSLVDELCADPKLQVSVLCGDEPYEPWVGRHDRTLLVTDFGRKHRRPLARLWWEGTRLRRWVEKSRCDLFHATWNHGVPRHCPIPVVLTVHDVIPWDAPVAGPSTWCERRAYRHAVRASVQRADRIVTVSQFTASQLKSRMQIDTSNPRVIYNGVGKRQPAQNQPQADRYFLYVGGHESRKNLEAVFRALNVFWHLHGLVGFRLTGTPDKLSTEARAAYLQLSHKDRVTYLGAPDDAELARQYAGAAALLMLSRAEGFGLPVIEAMGHGCPVIASCTGSLPEVVGDAGLLVDSEQTGQVVDAMIQTLDAAVAEGLRTRGLQRASEFTWGRAASEYFREYQQALPSACRMADCEPQPFSALATS